MKKLILALFMILMPHIAYAESAWVLWEKTQYNFISPPSAPELRTYWEIIEAIPSYKTCQEMRKNVWVSAEKMEKKNSDSSDKITSGHYSVDITSSFSDDKSAGRSLIRREFFCLPETVNPNLFEKRRD